MTRSGFVALLFCVGSLGSTGGCGDDAGNGAACVAPCGGEVVGDWIFGEPCVDTQMLTAFLAGLCRQAGVTAASGEVTGMLAFRADATFEITHAETLSYSFNVPVSVACMGTTSCAELDAALKLEDDSFACSGSSTCNCTFTESSTSLTETGTYTTSDTMLVTTSTSGTRTWSYCASLESLALRQSFITYRARPAGG